MICGTKSCIDLDKGIVKIFEREYYKAKASLVKPNEISESFKKVIKDISK